jgi:hypothetical protein
MERLGWRLRLLGITPDSLEKITGIKERRMWEKGTTGVKVRRRAKAPRTVQSAGC